MMLGEAKPLRDSCGEPLAGAFHHTDDDLQQVLRGQDQIITLMAQLLQAPPWPDAASDPSPRLRAPAGSASARQARGHWTRSGKSGRSPPDGP